MRAEPSKNQIKILESARVARMATVDPSGIPHIVPVCFVFNEGSLFTPIDKKPKTKAATSLKRVININSNPKVSFLIDKYYEDWKRLFFLKITGVASIIESGGEYDDALMRLCEKYTQYRDMDLLNLGLPVIKICPEKFISWGDVA